MPFADPEKRRIYNRELARRLRARNPEAVNAYQREWRKKNPNKHATYVRAWRKKNPAKVQLAERRRMEDPARGEAKRAYAREYQKKYRREQPRRVLTSVLKKNYGITIEQYEELLKHQKNRCYICRKTETLKQRDKINRLSVDHCARTGKVRGLLCSNCNRGLGMFLHNRKFLARAGLYLKTPPARILRAR